MKKLLILALIAVSILTACGKKDDNRVDDSTLKYTVDFEAACTDEAINEVLEYAKTINSGVPEETLKQEITNMAGFVRAANNLKLDLDDYYKEALSMVGGDSSIDEALKSGIPKAHINLVLAYHTSNSAIFDYMSQNNLLSDGKDYFLENYWRAKHVLVSTTDKTDAEKTEAKKKAEDILKRAQSGENFDKLVEEYSEDPGSKSSPDGYVFTTGEMVQEFEDGTKNTDIGKFCMVETSYGYHVIQRLAIDETPELYEKFYKEANIDAIVNETAVVDFVNKSVQ